MLIWKQNKRSCRVCSWPTCHPTTTPRKSSPKSNSCPDPHQCVSRIGCHVSRIQRMDTCRQTPDRSSDGSVRQNENKCQHSSRPYQCPLQNSPETTSRTKARALVSAQFFVPNLPVMAAIIVVQQHCKLDMSTIEKEESYLSSSCNFKKVANTKGCRDRTFTSTTINWKSSALVKQPDRPWKSGTPNTNKTRNSNRVPQPILSLIHIWRCRRYSLCRSRWSPYH